MDYARPALEVLELANDTACCNGYPTCMWATVPNQPPVSIPGAPEFHSDKCKVNAGIVGILCFGTS